MRINRSSYSAHLSLSESRGPQTAPKTPKASGRRSYMAPALWLSAVCLAAFILGPLLT